MAKEHQWTVCIGFNEASKFFIQNEIEKRYITISQSRYFGSTKHIKVEKLANRIVFMSKIISYLNFGF